MAMAQRKQLTWSELRVGLFVLVAMFILAVGVIYVTGAGTLGPKYTLRTYLPEVEGLSVGAPVRLDGIEIGNVDALRLNTSAKDRSQNIELVLRIDKRYQKWIRTDSTASLITEGLLGNRYVTISRTAGAITAAEIPPNGIVRGNQESSTKAIVERGAELMQNLSVMTEDVRQIVSKLQEGQGTIGKLITDESLYNRANDLVAKADQIVSSAQAGQGTIGELLASDELYKKADSTVARVDTLLADVQAQKGTLGKLVYDPSVYQEAKEFVSKGNTLFGDIQAGKGTLGKLATDETVYSNLRDASANVKSASARLSEGQGTLGKFFTDPQFYDNITGLSGDLRLLISDFRKDPKKFLRVKFAVF
jgi:phospholipid/cholesterol/gamma-HCH transport system substrate-binding protein